MGKYCPRNFPDNCSALCTLSPPGCQQDQEAGCCLTPGLVSGVSVTQWPDPGHTQPLVSIMQANGQASVFTLTSDLDLCMSDIG